MEGGARTVTLVKKQSEEEKKMQQNGTAGEA